MNWYKVAQVAQTAEPTADVSNSQAKMLLGRLSQAFPNIEQLWRNPGSSPREAVVNTLAYLASGIDAQNAGRLKTELMKLQQAEQAEGTQA